MDQRDLYLAAAAGLAGAVNAIAGGGTLLTFPALDAALGGTGSAAASVMANATSTVALWPGSMASFWGFRSEWAEARSRTSSLLLPSLIGGTIGAGLLIWLPAETFRGLVGYLILIATILFASQPVIGRWIGSPTLGAHPTTKQRLGIVFFQFIVAIYGGYFGAGIGILMLAALALLGMHDLNQMNGVKALLGALINGTSVVIFVAAGRVHWHYALVMMAASIAGGYFGARLARRLPRTLVRRTIVVIGLSLGFYYVIRP